MDNIIKFKMDNVELDDRKIFMKQMQDALIKEGTTEEIAEKLSNTVFMIIDKNIEYAMEQGVIEFLEAINEQIEEEFEVFVQGLRLGRQESRKGIE